MRITSEYDYRNAKGILEKKHQNILKSVYSILKDPKNKLSLKLKSKKQRDLSKQIQAFFIKKGWKKEQGTFAVPELTYDLISKNVPIEIEIGHERLVYADFFKFLVDYSKGKIDAGVMIVAGNPKKFGQSWHNNIKNTARKLEQLDGLYLVPILVIGIDP